MAAITNPGTKVTEFAGVYKLLALDNLSLASASEALTLSWADNGVSEIVTVVGSLSGSASVNITELSVSYSGLVITITALESDGTAATVYTSAKANLLVVCK